MKLIVLEGADGAGTSTHTDLLALSLRASGVDAMAFHHRKPSLGDPWRDALAYAEQRAALVASQPRGVVVADRWWHSSLTEGEARGHDGLLGLARAEGATLPRHAALVILTAPTEVLNARFAARGDEVTDLDHARRIAYRGLPSLLRCHVVDTSKPTPDVTRALLRLALAALPVESER